MEQMCLRSFLAIGYDAHLYVYGPVEGISRRRSGDGRLGDFSPDQIFRQGPGYGEGSYATFSDRFRYYLLLKMGGWWFDLDFEALRLKPEPADLLLHPNGIANLVNTLLVVPYGASQGISVSSGLEINAITD